MPVLGAYNMLNPPKISHFPLGRLKKVVCFVIHIHCPTKKPILESDLSVGVEESPALLFLVTSQYIFSQNPIHFGI